MVCAQLRPRLRCVCLQGMALKNESLEVVRQLELPQGWDTSRNGVSQFVFLLARSQQLLEGKRQQAPCAVCSVGISVPIM